MALMQGKGNKIDFGGAQAGKPQKQALAIAYNVRKRMGGKKMAKGGEVPEEDMGREYMKPHEGPQTDDENHMLRDDASGEGSPTSSLAREDLSAAQMERTRPGLDEPDEPAEFDDRGDPELFERHRVDPDIRNEPKEAQAKFSTEENGAYFAKGGEVKSAMGRRERALMAARQNHPSLEEDRMAHASKYPNGEGSPLQEPGGKGMRAPAESSRINMDVKSGGHPMKQLSQEEQGAFMSEGGMASHGDMAKHHREMADHYQRMADGGPSLGVDTSMQQSKFAPLNQAPSQKQAPAQRAPSDEGGPGALQQGTSDLIKGAQSRVKSMSRGGYAEPHSSEEEQGRFYNRGGITPERGGGNEISSPRRPYENEAPGYGQAPSRLKPEEEGERFAMGGYAHGGKSIAGAIRAKKMAQGGKVYSDDDRPEDGESIDNFRRDSHPDNDFLSSLEQTDYHPLNEGDMDEESDKPKRKGMLDRIMRGIHAKNGN